jgi:hypothetical protein
MSDRGIAVGDRMEAATWLTTTGSRPENGR